MHKTHHGIIMFLLFIIFAIFAYFAFPNINKYERELDGSNYIKVECHILSNDEEYKRKYLISYILNGENHNVYYESKSDMKIGTSFQGYVNISSEEDNIRLDSPHEELNKSRTMFCIFLSLSGVFLIIGIVSFSIQRKEKV